MELNEKSKRKTWTKEEVLGLLKCYLARKDEFQHSRKKKFAYANVLEDMVFQGLTDARTTGSALEGKIKTLLAAFKAAKDNRNQTGATPVVVPYTEQMEEIFGDKPLIANSHTINCGRAPTSPLSEIPSPVPPEITSPSIVKSSSPSTSPLLQTPKAKKATKRIGGRERLMEAKIKARKIEQKSKREQKEALFSKMQKTLSEHFKAQQDILRNAEEKKIKLLPNVIGVFFCVNFFKPI